MFDVLEDVTTKAGSVSNKFLDTIELSLDLLNNELKELKETQEIRLSLLKSKDVRKAIEESMKKELELKIARKDARLKALGDKYK
jgi:hypothetical protein